ncbi:MAG: chemotaxis protein CheD [Clostridia bacterium]|nr:chemotaxis protein CheD [Clostridia bacterium]
MDSVTQKLVVGIADMKLARNGEELITYALGSCIGICLYDPSMKLAALIHIMLPINMETGRKNPMKYADTGIRETLKAMETRGASRARITAKIAGGAKMFESSGGNGGLGNIGKRNVESVYLVLKNEGIKLLADDTGGTTARTLSFDSSSGQGHIRSYGKPDMII